MSSFFVLIFLVIKLLNLFVSTPVVDKIANNKTTILKIDIIEKIKYTLHYLFFIPSSINSSIFPSRTLKGFVLSILLRKSFTN